MSSLWLAAFAVVSLNLPFGYWRAGTRKFSAPWFFAVHLPVPLVIAVRFAAGLGFHLVTYPVLVGAFFTGQYLGGRLRGRRRGGVVGAGRERRPGPQNDTARVPAPEEDTL